MAAPPAASRHRAAAGDWLNEVLPRIHAEVATAGAVLVRGLPVRSAADLRPIRDVVLPTPASATELFAPRRDLGDGVFSAMRWPPDRALCPQHEQSYSLEFPKLLLLACLRPAVAGGQTWLADSRLVLRHLPADLVDQLCALGWLLTRTFRERVGMSWREAFRVADGYALAELLTHNHIGYEWLRDGALRTSRLRSAVVHHPDSGDACWFNHAGFLNEWGLEPEEREVMRAAFGPDGLPANTCVGDGTPLEPDAVRAIERAYEECAIAVDWAAGDLLLLDNIRLGHGRRPYTGEREIAVAMGEPVRLADCRPTTAPRAWPP
jgi:alpha-ketoglutarate-dependent taurine dioxygenase